MLYYIILILFEEKKQNFLKRSKIVAKQSKTVENTVIIDTKSVFTEPQKLIVNYQKQAEMVFLVSKAKKILIVLYIVKQK